MGVIHVAWVIDGAIMTGTACGFLAEGDGREWMFARELPNWCTACMEVLADWSVEAAARSEARVVPSVDAKSPTSRETLMHRHLAYVDSLLGRLTRGEIPALIRTLRERLGGIAEAPGVSHRHVVGQQVTCDMRWVDAGDWTPEALRERQARRQSRLALEAGTRVTHPHFGHRLEAPADTGHIYEVSDGHGLLYRVCHADPPCYSLRGGELTLKTRGNCSHHVWYEPREVTAVTIEAEWPTPQRHLHGHPDGDDDPYD